MSNLDCIILAFIMPFGFIYALELSFPDNLKYTFEFIQMIIMNVDGHKLNTNIQQLKFAWVMHFFGTRTLCWELTIDKDYYITLKKINLYITTWLMDDFMCSHINVLFAEAFQICFPCFSMIFVCIHLYWVLHILTRVHTPPHAKNTMFYYTDYQ